MAALLMIVIAISLAACEPPAQLPPEAEQALKDYWQALPADPPPGYQILEVWPGVVPADTTGGVLMPLEVWCVEAEISSAADEAIVGEKFVWILTRREQTAPWQAAMLATMSSTWPYEACARPLP